MEPMMWYLIASAIMTTVTNIALSERQKNWDEEMMDKQNDYNLPENQMKRLEDAGINPASFGMGQGMSISGNISAGNNGYQLPMIGDPMNMASNSMLQMMQSREAGEKALSEKDSRQVRIDNIKAQTDKYRAEVVQLGLDSRAQEIANSWADQMNEISVQKDLSVINLNKAQIENLASLTDKNIFELQNVLPEQVRKLVEERKLNVLQQDEVVAEIKRIYADVNLKDAQAGLVKQETETEYREQALVSQESALTEEQVNMLRHQIQQFLDTYEDVVTKVSNEAKLSTREVKAFWIKLALSGVKDTGAVAGGAGVLLKALSALK